MANSIESKFARFIFSFSKKDWQTVEGLYKGMKTKTNPKPPLLLQKKYTIQTNYLNNRRYYRMRPKRKEVKHVILFIHGGGYVHELNLFHWYLLGNLVDELDAEIFIPIYPLACKEDYRATFTFLLELYPLILKCTETKKLTLMGDSAGGGISFSFSQLLYKQKMKQPKDIILFSPVLDLTFQNPEVYEMEKKDPILALPGIEEAARLFSGEAPLDDYLISPIYGDFTGLGRLTLFIGTDELLLSDARRFKAMMEKKGIPLHYFEYEGMYHDWILTPIPEAKDALQKLTRIIKQNQKMR